MRHTWVTGLCRTATAIVVAALLLTFSTRHAKTEDVAALPLARPLLAQSGGKPTPAWNSFCARLPEECRIDPAEPALVTLTPEVWHLLKRTNNLWGSGIEAAKKAGVYKECKPLGSEPNQLGGVTFASDALWTIGSPVSTLESRR